MNYIKELIRISMSDLVASKVLFNHGLFPQSYFYFQQSVEKGNKALGLLSGHIKISELEGIGHSQLKLYKKIIAKQHAEIQETMTNLRAFNEDTQNKINDFFKISNTVDQLDKSKKYFDSVSNQNIMDIDEDTIQYFIGQITELKNREFKDISLNDQHLLTKLQEFASLINSINPHAVESKEEEIQKYLENIENKRQLEDVLNEFAPLLKNLVIANMTLYLFGLITIMHNSQSRYIVNYQSPLTTYTQDKPEIKHLPLLHNFLDESLRHLLEIVDSIPPEAAT